MTAQAQRLKAANPDVIFAQAVPPPAASLVKAAREILNWDVPIVVTGVVAADIFIQLAGAENAEGVVSVVFAQAGLPDGRPRGPASTSRSCKDFGQGVEASNFTLYGAVRGRADGEGAGERGAEPDPGEPDRGRRGHPRLVLLRCALMPVNLSPTDHRPCEIEVYNRVENGKWVTFGEPVISSPHRARPSAARDWTSPSTPRR